MRWSLIVLAVAACDSSTYAPDATPVDAVDCSSVPADTQVEVASSGIVTGDTVIPISPTAAGDLVIVAIASDAEANFESISIADGTKTLQNAMGRTICGKTAYHEAFFDVGPAADAVRFSPVAPGNSVIFVARFSGLSIADDAHKGRYAWSEPESGPDVNACPGTAMVTTSISCGELALAADSPFTMIDSVQGMAAAAYVPTEPGSYGARWVSDSESTSMTIAFP